MKFEDFEVGKEYDRPGFPRRRLVAKTPKEMCLDLADGTLVVRSAFDDFTGWRPYVPPPAPLVRFLFAADEAGILFTGMNHNELFAINDIDRIGPVVRVELPIDPTLLARVRDGAE